MPGRPAAEWNSPTQDERKATTNETHPPFDRRLATAAAAGLIATSSLAAQGAKPTVPHYAGPREDVSVPRPGMTPESGRVALVLTDPQNDFLSPNGVAWGVVRELLEQGFEVVVAVDATAAAKLPGFDGYEAAFVNFRLMASDVWSTAQTVKIISTLK